MQEGVAISAVAQAGGRASVCSKVGGAGTGQTTERVLGGGGEPLSVSLLLPGYQNRVLL